MINWVSAMVQNRNDMTRNTKSRKHLFTRCRKKNLIFCLTLVAYQVFQFKEVRHKRITEYLLEAELHKRVIGQNKLSLVLVIAIRRNQSGIRNNKRQWIFMFLGPG